MADAPGLPFPLPRVGAADRRRAADLLAALDLCYPNATCELRYSAPHELLVATILSAQCTDAAVNKATPGLFSRFPTPGSYAAATPAEIEPFVRSLGFFRNKALAVHRSMAAVHERFGGRVPQTMADLLSLHGVARKTANVVLGNAFGVNEGVVVDTHVQRLARRFCLVEEGTTVTMIERRLMALFPRERWADLPHLLIAHGRRACAARGKGCADHPVCSRFGRCCDRRAGGAAVTEGGSGAPAAARGRSRRPPSKPKPRAG